MCGLSSAVMVVGAVPQASELACIGERLPILILVVPPEAASFDTWSAHLSLPVRPTQTA
jgi:hypothetical protein